MLQIEFWISISNNVRENKRWTYQSIRDIQKTFKFWSLSTINRTAKSLIDKKLLYEGNFNKMKYDNTRWFSLNFEELNKLKAITVKGVETGVCQKETGSNQKETGSTQKETTIPETSSKTSSKTSYNKPTYNKPYKKLNNRSSHERQYDAKELEKKLLGEGEE